MPHKDLAGAHHRDLRPNVRRQHGYSKVSERGNLNWERNQPHKRRTAYPLFLRRRVRVKGK